MQPASSANEIISSRVFAVPRDEVWGAFAEPSRLARWWGPAGFTNTFHEFDLRTGGRWRFTMHGPDGAVYEQLREFVAVVAHERIVMDNPNPVHRFRMTIELTAEGAGTRLGWSMVFHDAAEFVRVKSVIVAANEEVFDRLEAVLEEEG